MKVSPSILVVDFAKIKEEIDSIKTADYLHLDIMDGHFVPNISFGSFLCKSLKPHTNLPFDVHLMISDPYKYAKDFILAGADILTFHLESLDGIDKVIELIDYIHSFNVKAGVSIKPATDVKSLDCLLDKVDLILIMSVEPGFGGQTFMENSLEKIAYLKKKKDENNYNYFLEVDGGINLDNAILCKKSGVDILVAGTFIFKQPDRKKIIKELQEL